MEQANAVGTSVFGALDLIQNHFIVSFRPVATELDLQRRLE